MLKRDPQPLTDEQITSALSILAEMDAIPDFEARSEEEDARLDELVTLWEVRSAMQHEAALLELQRCRAVASETAPTLEQAVAVLNERRHGGREWVISSPSRASGRPNKDCPGVSVIDAFTAQALAEKYLR